MSVRSFIREFDMFAPLETVHWHLRKKGYLRVFHRDGRGELKEEEIRWSLEIVRGQAIDIVDLGRVRTAEEFVRRLGVEIEEGGW